MAENKTSENHLSYILRDLTAGTLAGVAGTAFTHPLDTIRVRMQLQPYPKIYKTMLHCGAATIKKEGVRGLFKGVVSSSLGNAPVFSMCFAAKELATRLMKPLELSQGVESYISGCIAGATCCITTVPAEQLKCRAQANKSSFIEYRKEVRNIWDRKGIKGIYQGWWISLCRDVPN